jgi:hypothetical protein
MAPSAQYQASRLSIGEVSTGGLRGGRSEMFAATAAFIRLLQGLPPEAVIAVAKRRMEMAARMVLAVML